MHSNWKALSTVHWKWKQFVRENDDTFINYDSTVQKPQVENFISGAEARALYEEEFLNNSKTKLEPKPKQVKKNESKPQKEIPSVAKEQWLNTILKASENNDIKTVRDLFRQNPERINEADSFGWTALMSASHANSVSVVQFLLENRVNERLRNQKGLTALRLAYIKGNQQVISIFSNREETKKERKKSPPSPPTFDCATCKMTFNNTSIEDHNNSTVHLFNNWKGPQKTHWSIPQSNRGFQMMLKNGWGKEEGLGPSGEGKKFPVKTVLKRDRYGFGSNIKEKARVTHFSSGSLDAIKNPRYDRFNKYNKRDWESISKKEKRKERAWRRELNSFD